MNCCCTLEEPEYLDEQTQAAQLKHYKDESVRLTVKVAELEAQIKPYELGGSE
jgi:hypothetical protein